MNIINPKIIVGILLLAASLSATPWVGAQQRDLQTLRGAGPLDETNPLYKAHQEAYQPMAAYPLEYDSRFYFGERVPRRLGVRPVSAPSEDAKDSPGAPAHDRPRREPYSRSFTRGASRSARERPRVGG